MFVSLQNARALLFFRHKLPTQGVITRNHSHSALQEEAGRNFKYCTNGCRPTVLSGGRHQFVARTEVKAEVIHSAGRRASLPCFVIGCGKIERSKCFRKVKGKNLAQMLEKQEHYSPLVTSSQHSTSMSSPGIFRTRKQISKKALQVLYPRKQTHRLQIGVSLMSNKQYD